jgi:serine/threonine protein kinase
LSIFGFLSGPKLLISATTLASRVANWHRDIKGANILVDNGGCIKLADFGASKKVVKLGTISEPKSMKGTPYWMAPEVIRQTGHNWQADMSSVGCTVIEMATGKRPWSQQFQEVVALFHIGTTNSHPPIPDHLSHQGKDFLLNCLQREPTLRPSTTELLKHPFVLTCEIQGGLDGSEYNNNKQLMVICSSSRQIGETRNCDL